MDTHGEEPKNSLMPLRGECIFGEVARMSGKSCSKGKVVFCDGNDAEGLYSGHPRVYIKITEEKQQCPYCGKVLN